MSNLDAALKHHQGGRLDEAEQIYRDILKSQPEHSDSWHLLGVIAAQRGEAQQAVELIENAIRLDPTVAAYHTNLGKALRAKGRLDAAIDAFGRALAIHFDNDTLDSLAQTIYAQGPVEQAVDIYLRALAARPQDPRARQGLVSMLRTVRPAGAWAELEQQLVECYRSADIAHQHLAGISANQLKYKYAFAARPPLPAVGGDAFLDALSQDQLLLALLTQTVNVDFEIEQFLSALRRRFLLEHGEARGGREGQAVLLGALAQQCFNNQFVFNVDAEEAAAAEKLKHRVCEQLTRADASMPPELELEVLLLASYFPLASLPCARELEASMTGQRWSPRARALLQRTLTEPLAERAIEAEIESVGEIADTTSKDVRAQYEENPYPRWLDIGRSDEHDLTAALRAQFPSFTPPECVTANPRVLIAGCGTGEEAIKFALANRSADVLAIDLSRRSLAYAVRMARMLGVTNVRFLQCDILELEKLGEQFHVVSSVGVLHHLADPIAGWRVLAQILAPSGLMRMALYSEIARRPLTAAREQIARRGLRPVAEDIRRFRTLVLSGALSGELADFSTGREFYSLGECRDLLFHIKEHLFTPGQIREALAELHLELIGFDLSRLNAPPDFLERLRQARNTLDFTVCERIEQQYPRAFFGMYRFWCQKP